VRRFRSSRKLGDASWSVRGSGVGLKCLSGDWYGRLRAQRREDSLTESVESASERDVMAPAREPIVGNGMLQNGSDMASM